MYVHRNFNVQHLEEYSRNTQQVPAPKIEFSRYRSERIAKTIPEDV